MSPNDALLTLLADLQTQILGLRAENAALREQLASTQGEAEPKE